MMPSPGGAGRPESRIGITSWYPGMGIDGLAVEPGLGLQDEVQVEVRRDSAG